MKRIIKWGRAKGGFVVSKGTRYRISPLYCGSTRPHAYASYDTLNERTIGSYATTIAEAKEDVQRYVDRIYRK